MSLRKHSLFFLFGLVILGVILFFFSRNVTIEPPSPIVSSELIGKPLPQFDLPLLSTPNKNLTPETLKGQVSLLNIWATWCHACRFEHPFLLDIQKEYHIPIYGIDYGDNSANAEEWLKKAGNPYVMTAVDPQGEITDILDVGGTPQTFIIDAKGIVRYRHLGPINERIWREELWPIVQQYQREKS